MRFSICWHLITVALGSLAIVVFPTLDQTAAREPLKVIRITPSGVDVPTRYQIQIEFNKSMVALGRMGRTAKEVPIAITPKINCTWQWVATSALACQLSGTQALRRATSYSVTVSPKIAAEDGSKLNAAYKHTFITERPKASFARIINWTAPDSPVINVYFNQNVTKASLEKHLFIMASGDASGRYRVTVTRIVDEYNAEETEQPQTPGDLRWQITSAEPLPQNTNMELRIEPGIFSIEGDYPGGQTKTLRQFHTFPPFRFLGVTCYDAQSKSQFITADNNTKLQCNPGGGIYLSFSAPAVRSTVVKNLASSPGLATSEKIYHEWLAMRDYSGLNEITKKGKKYNVSLPTYVQAGANYQITEKMKGQILDQFGRKLTNSVAIKFKTGHRTPSFALIHRTSVLEQHAATKLPLYVTNIDKLKFNYQQLTAKGSKANLSTSNNIPDVPDTTFAVGLGLDKILAGGSGALYGSLSTSPPTNQDPYTSTLFAQVTPYQVHAKIGHFSSLVWVSDMATGKPVEGARIRFFEGYLNQLAKIGDNPVGDEVTTNSDGLAVFAGNAQMDPSLDRKTWRCIRDKNIKVRNDEEEALDGCLRLFVQVTKGNNFAILPLQSDFKIDVYRVSGYNVWNRPRGIFGHWKAWGTTAQGIYKPGATIQYKIYVRAQDNQGYISPVSNSYQNDYTVRLVDPKGNVIHQTQGVKLSKFGAYDGEFQLPKNSAFGRYYFEIESEAIKSTLSAMSVLVTDFTPASFKVVSSINGDIFHYGDKVMVESRALFHSGTPYSNAKFDITAYIDSTPFSPNHPLASTFTFGDYDYNSGGQIFYNSYAPASNGENNASFIIKDTKTTHGRLMVISSARDERGKSVSVRASGEYLAVDRVVGLKSSQWLFQTGKNSDIDYLVVDSKGIPLPGVDVSLMIDHYQPKTAKVKSAGTVYTNRTIQNWRNVAKCHGISAQIAKICRFIPQKAGKYRVTAQIVDSKGREQSTSINVYATGDSYVLWDDNNDNALTILPERLTYSVGEKARYLIRNPYPGAYALITIERYGILKSWVQTLNGSTPTIEFDIDEKLAPGFYLSVVVVSPRVGDAPVDIGQLDLAKPTFRIGYLRVPVIMPGKQLDIKLATDATSYKPGDKVEVKLTVKPLVGGESSGKNPPVEVAVVVIDEAVLDLIIGGKDYFNPYSGFYRLDDLDVANFSLLTRLIGLQKIEIKGANPGGGGAVGGRDVRSLFKYVSYWNPSIIPDEHGDATFSFDAPDNLTGWRVLAIGVTPGALMALGETSFKVTKQIEIRPATPNQVSAGDSFNAGFAIYNRTGKPRDVTVKISASGSLANGGNQEQVYHKRLAAHGRDIVYLPVDVAPDNGLSSPSQIRFRVSAESDGERDGVVHGVMVNEKAVRQTVSAYGSTQGETARQSILIPQDIITGRLSIIASPSIIADVSGAFDYSRKHSYNSWEQKLSKALMADYWLKLKDRLPSVSTWPDARQDIDQALSAAPGFQAPNGGMSYFIAENNYVSPYLSAYSALAFGWLYDYPVNDQMQKRLNAYLKGLLKNDFNQPSLYSLSATATVRVLALAALARDGQITAADVERYRSHLEQMDLFGKAHYLIAAVLTKSDRKLINDIVNQLLANSNTTGSYTSFSEDEPIIGSAVLSTPLRSNCAILSAFAAMAKNDILTEIFRDISFSLARYVIVKRGRRNHWYNSQETVFCTKALIDYTEVYENQKPNLKIKVTNGGEVLGVANFDDITDEPKEIGRALNDGDKGVKQQVVISRHGEGRLYYSANLDYLVTKDFDVRQNAGFDISQEYSVIRNDQLVALNNPIELVQGDVVRVDVFVTLPAAREFVAVTSPIPGGLEPINPQLSNNVGTSERQARLKLPGSSRFHRLKDWEEYGFYHTEFANNQVRFYAEYLSGGNYHLVYFAQAIATGQFAILPPRVQEIYNQDVSGLGLSRVLVIDQ